MECWANLNQYQRERLSNAISDPLLAGLVLSFLKELNKADFTKLKPFRVEDVFVEWEEKTNTLLNHIHPTMLVGALEDLIARRNQPISEIEFEAFMHNGNKQEKKSVDPAVVKLDGKLKITSVAEHYGIEVKRNMAKCPFHDDKSPSLSLSNDKNVFHCFGCKSKGDIVTFIRMLEDLKNDN